LPLYYGVNLSWVTDHSLPVGRDHCTQKQSNATKVILVFGTTQLHQVTRYTLDTFHLFSNK